MFVILTLTFKSHFVTVVNITTNFLVVTSYPLNDGPNWNTGERGRRPSRKRSRALALQSQDKNNSMFILSFQNKQIKQIFKGYGFQCTLFGTKYFNK